MLNPSDLAGRLRAGASRATGYLSLPISPSLPRSGLIGSRGLPEDRSALRAGTVWELEGRLTLRTWQDAPGQGTPGLPVPFRQHPTPLAEVDWVWGSAVGRWKGRDGGMDAEPSGYGRAPRILPLSRPIPSPSESGLGLGGRPGVAGRPKREPEGR